jgi:hypothetical protein
MGGYALSGKGQTERTDLPDHAPGPYHVGTRLHHGRGVHHLRHLMAAATLAPRCRHTEPERDAFQRHNERNST